jgi:glycosyltransferase involved in cell wall biosynthesis
MDKDRYDDFQGADVISLPNFFDIPEVDRAVKDVDAPPVFSMVGRNDNVKGVPASISILARLREEMELQCIGISTQFPSDHRAKLAQAHIPSSLIPWTTWQKSLEIIASYVDVGLQLSQSESFNLVSIEHMALGKPMIATPAIEYIPQEWQINPQNPREGVRVAKRILENYEEESEKAKIVALAVGTRCNETLLENLTPLIKR